MHITLISTSTFPSDQGIRTVSAVLKKAGFDVTLVFMTLSEDYSKKYSQNELKQLGELCKGSGMIGINSFASTAERAEQIISYLKEEFPDTPLVYGGVHATISPEDCIKHCDIVCVGEAEEAIKELTHSLEVGVSIDNIPNLWIKKGKGIIKNPVRDLIDDLDRIPLPDYDTETHYILEKGKIRNFHEKDLTGAIFFLTGRGCPYGCDYCSNSLLNKLYAGKCKKILRWHSPEYIIKGILQLKKQFPTLAYFDIRDDTFSLRPFEDIKRFCELYKKKVNMRFKCLADPKTVTKEKIRMLVDAGCTDIIVGIQGSERSNKEIYHRYQSNQEIMRCAKILNKFVIKKKLAVMYDVITCNPYEKPEDIIDLIRLLQKIPKPYFLSVNNLVFFPGTKMYDRAIADGTIKNKEDAAYQLNYWDRSKHLLLKKKNIYLNLILNLMRGSVTKRRFGFMTNFFINFLLKKERVDKRIKHPWPAYGLCYCLSIFDWIREKILKPTYRSLPTSFKVWYDKVRYRV